MRHSPLDDALSAFNKLSPEDQELVAAGEARPDLQRERRTGVPEVIYASGKDFDQIVALTETFVQRSGRAIVSRLRESAARALTGRFDQYEIRYQRRARMLVIREPGSRPNTGGKVGIITAGTSDLPVAEQAQVMAEEMGCGVTLISDVGVAGLHRLFTPLGSLLEAGADVLVVCAGMDGALPSVVSGLVDLPVIGVPTSTGYGVGGKGLAALLTMLQTCAPGLTVVNVDNGVGAGITAALIANRVARARAQ